MSSGSTRRRSVGSGYGVVVHDTPALLLRRTNSGEADVVVTLLTEKLGRVAALARAARASRKRFSGSLEPMHTLSVTLEERASSDLMLLREASLSVPRRRLLQSLEGLEAAGKALVWARRAVPPHAPEPAIWRLMNGLLDTLDAKSSEHKPGPFLVCAALQMLAALGWGLDLVRCVRCGRTCAPDRRAMIDAAQGGLVCRACGGASVLLAADVRARLVRANAGEPVLEEGDVPCALSLVEAALRAHAGLE